ncbi:MAG: HNH endonuclease signature motif containing protein [Blastocatellia bacterium]
MTRHVSDELRQLVITRAENLCEYCLIEIEDTYFGGEVDHVISLKHEGLTTADNLAYTCQPCNRNKGSDLGSISRKSRRLVRFFNPRTDHWADHFVLNKAFIRSLTEIGEVTARILGFNQEERLLERQGLIADGHYPSSAARKRMRKRRKR